ncbi:MAG: nucleotide sugar dehydrogenase [Phototrophicales bacterium]|nr:nucleotide sugar dehydrogenase [Phototrophicales bacterium]
MSIKQTLLNKFRTKQAQVAIIGLGYVGLPMAVEFALSGLRVVGIDLDTHKVDHLNRGESYIADVLSDTLRQLVQDGRLWASVDYSTIQNCDAVIICVPTPLSETKDPDLSYVLSALASLAPHLHPAMLISLESTTYPGTTEEVLRPSLEANGLVVGEELFLVFSAERIDPANKKYGFRNTPKVIGGITPACGEVAYELFQMAVEQVVLVSSPTVAEMSKLLENTFRAVNIGLVNEMALMCDKLGINVWEVIHAASSKPFGFMPFYPGPGLGGHCIPLDPHYLAWKMRTLGYQVKFIQTADEINSAMPAYVVDKVMHALNDERKALNGATILILGVAYKRDIDDVRESPALEIFHLLQKKGAVVTYHDPHIAQFRAHNGDVVNSITYSAQALASADCVIIVTDHSAYDWAHVLENSHLILDTRNASGKFNGKARVIGL